MPSVFESRTPKSERRRSKEDPPSTDHDSPTCALSDQLIVSRALEILLRMTELSAWSGDVELLLRKILEIQHSSSQNLMSHG